MQSTAKRCQIKYLWQMRGLSQNLIHSQQSKRAQICPKTWTGAPPCFAAAHAQVCRLEPAVTAHTVICTIGAERRRNGCINSEQSHISSPGHCQNRLEGDPPFGDPPFGSHAQAQVPEVSSEAKTSRGIAQNLRGE